MKRYNLLLIMPRLEEQASNISPFSWQRFEVFVPYALLRIASLTPDHYNIEIFDEQVDWEIPKTKPDIVGICAHSFLTHRAIILADYFRKRGSKVVVGGAYASINPNHFKASADSVIVGDAEPVWERLLEDFEKGGLKRTYRAVKLPDITHLPEVDWSLTKNKRYIFKTVTQTSRGCTKFCEFCSLVRLSKGIVRTREIGEVIKEIEDGIKTNTGRFRNWVFFCDSDIYANPTYAVELFKQLRRLNIRWFAQSSIIIGADTNITKLARDSGCRGLYIGLESINPRCLTNSPFKLNNVDNYEEYLKNIKSQNIIVIGAFILGFDDDRIESVQKTCEFATRNHIDLIELEILRAYPTTEICHRIEKERITHDFEVTPKNIGLFELKKKINEAYSEFYSWTNIAKRGLHYLMSTWNYKYTIYGVFYSIAKRRQILKRIHISPISRDTAW